MEKIFWVRSMSGLEENNGLRQVNRYLSDGWTVKMISSVSMRDEFGVASAYIVLEKQDEA